MAVADNIVSVLWAERMASIAVLPPGAVIELQEGASDLLRSGFPAWAVLLSMDGGFREVSGRQSYQFGPDGSSPAATFDATADSDCSVIGFFLHAEGGCPIAIAKC